MTPLLIVTVLGLPTVSYDAFPITYGTWVTVLLIVDVTYQADVVFSDMYK